MEVKTAVKMMAKQAWGRWVRLSSYVDADPYILLIPASATIVGLLVILVTW
jgi:hypothetical protein